MSYPPPPPPMTGAGGDAPPHTSGKAIAALASGIAGVPLVLCCGFLSGVPAVVLALLARREINRSSARVTGDGLALAGLILGGLAVAIGIALTILVFTTGRFSEIYGDPASSF